MINVTNSQAIADILDHWFNVARNAERIIIERYLASASLRVLEDEEVLLHAGTRSDKLFFVHEGLLRLYYTNPDGKERNKAFFGPGNYAGAVSAAMTDSSAPFSIQALSATTLLQIDFRQLYADAPGDPELSRAVIALLSQAFIRNEQREAMLLTLNAEQRYLWLQDNEPELLAALPQYHIASYLGVDAVSLSRLKRKLNLQ